jgi:hypothetical protein
MGVLSEPESTFHGPPFYVTTDRRELALTQGRRRSVGRASGVIRVAVRLRMIEDADLDQLFDLGSPGRRDRRSLGVASASPLSCPEQSDAQGCQADR